MHAPNKRKNEKGAVIMLFAAALTSMLLGLGMAIDLGTAYIAGSTLSKAVDAGALAGARYSGGSMAQIEDLAIEVAGANLQDVDIPIAYTAEVTIPAIDTLRVSVSATTETETFFARIVGTDSVAVRSLAQATRFPLDMSLVLDVSYSLERSDSFDDMQDAAESFVSFFNDDVDQVGLVTYSTWAEQRHSVSKNFASSMTSTIGSLTAYTDTNMEEGLRLAKAQMDVAPNRDNAVKIVVLFTDGRPTAFADNFYLNLATPRPEYYEGIVASYADGTSTRGLFRSSDGDKIRYFHGSTGDPVTIYNSSLTTSFHMPVELPGGSSVNGANIRSIGTSQSEAWANQIRNAGYTIYSIGLGNPAPEEPGDVPDLDLLRRLANEDGISSGSQPEGELLFAPTPAELEGVFAALADRILTRLTR